MKTLTIEQLSEKLNGKLWVKGDIKRIYLDCGYNTKKMSTKTYIFQRQDGTYGVSCIIDCPSQHDNWINREQNSIIERVEQNIEDAFSDTVYILINNKNQMLDHSGKVCTIDNCVNFLSQSEAEKEIENCSYYHNFIVMNRDEFQIEVEKAEETERNLPLKIKLERGDSISFYAGNLEEIKAKLDSEGILENLTANVYSDLSGSFKLKKEGDKSAMELINEQKNKHPKNDFEQIKIALQTGKKYQHSKFGIGTVISETKEVVEIFFEKEGAKKLIKQFAKLIEVE